MTPQPTPTPTPLFGGAITALLPPALLDVSTLRQVPDNQEVWVDSTANNGASLIVELLHLDAEVSADALATFHLGQVLLTAAEGADEEPEYELLDASTLPESSCAISHAGFPVLVKRAVAHVPGLHKFNKPAEASPVMVMVWVVRVPHVETDVVVTWNLPVGAAAPGVVGAPPGVNVTRPVVGKQFDRALVDRCEVVVRSLRVEDWGLFC